LEFDFFITVSALMLMVVDETQEEITHTNLLCLRVKIVERT